MKRHRSTLSTAAALLLFAAAPASAQWTRVTDLPATNMFSVWANGDTLVAVPGDAAPGVGLGFALSGRQPVGDDVRFRFDLPAPGNAVIELFNVAGRRAMEPIQGSWSAGAHEVSWSAWALGPGVYEARLTFAGRREVVRLVRVR